MTDDIDEVVARLMAYQAAVGERHALINGWVDDIAMADSLAASARDTLVARHDGVVVGHLRGTVLASSVYGESVWINPEGVSYDNPEILSALYAAAATRWLGAGATRHYVWVPRDDDAIGPWRHLGFAYMHQRGAKYLEDPARVEWPEGYAIRRGSIDDLEVALELDDVLRLAQEEGPSFALGLADTGQRDEWIETLEDPTVTHYLVEHDGHAVAQCATFALPERVGTFDNTVHLSAVSVRPEHRARGVGRAMVTHALETVRREGFAIAETNWRVTNHRAGRYWRSFGFEETYLRLHRHVGVG